jgi:hypothetical protein
MLTPQGIWRPKTMKLIRVVLVIVAGFVAAGCASDPRRDKGLSWVVEQQQERSRLQAQGFPQYSVD